MSIISVPLFLKTAKLVSRWVIVQLMSMGDDTAVQSLGDAPISTRIEPSIMQ